jgi:phage terminase large subunit
MDNIEDFEVVEVKVIEDNGSYYFNADLYNKKGDYNISIPKNVVKEYCRTHSLDWLYSACLIDDVFESEDEYYPTSVFNMDMFVSELDCDYWEELIKYAFVNFSSSCIINIDD